MIMKNYAWKNTIKMRLVRIEAMIITSTAAVIALLVQLSFFN